MLNIFVCAFARAGNLLSLTTAESDSFPLKRCLPNFIFLSLILSSSHFSLSLSPSSLSHLLHYFVCFYIHTMICVYLFFLNPKVSATAKVTLSVSLWPFVFFDLSFFPPVSNQNHSCHYEPIQ